MTIQDKLENIKNRAKGFTLIELLVVVSIISLLASIILASLRTARQKATDSTFTSLVVQIRNAMELYRSDNGYYPGQEPANGNAAIPNPPFTPRGNFCYSTFAPTSCDVQALLNYYLFPKYFSKQISFPSNVVSVGFTSGLALTNNGLGYTQVTCGTTQASSYVLEFLYDHTIGNYPAPAGGYPIVGSFCALYQ